MLPLHGHLEGLYNQLALLRWKSALNGQATIVVVVIAQLPIIVAFFRRLGVL
jgi:hypothetical protein